VFDTIGDQVQRSMIFVVGEVKIVPDKNNSHSIR
jgi:hypothetical protein